MATTMKPKKKPKLTDADLEINRSMSLLKARQIAIEVFGEPDATAAVVFQIFDALPLVDGALDDDDQKALVGALKLAQQIASDVLGVPASDAATVLEVFHTMPLDEDDYTTDEEDAAKFQADLIESVNIAKETFATEIATPEMVLGVCDRVFIDEDDEEDEDEE